MNHDTMMIIAMILTWGSGLVGIGIGRIKFNSRVMSFVLGWIGFLIGLSITIAIFGIK